MNPKERWKKEFALDYKTIKDSLGKGFTKIEICCKSNSNELKGFKNYVSERTFDRMFSEEYNCREINYEYLKQRFKDIIDARKLNTVVYKKITSNPEFSKFEKIEDLFNKLINQFVMFEKSSRDEKSALLFRTKYSAKYLEVYELIQQFEEAIIILKNYDKFLEHCRALCQVLNFMLVACLRCEYLGYFDELSLKMREPDIPAHKSIFNSIRRDIVQEKGKVGIRNKMSIEDIYEETDPNKMQKKLLKATPILIKHEEIYDKLASRYSHELRILQNEFNNNKNLLLSIFHQKRNDFFQDG